MPHLYDHFVLEETDRLSHDSTTNTVVIDQLREGADHFSDRPAARHQICLDQVRDRGGTLTEASGASYICVRGQ